MIFKLFFLTIFFLSGAQNIFGCSAAYQYSLFPMGMSMGQLVVLEVEMNRYLNSPAEQMIPMYGMESSNMNEIEVRWKGTLKLMYYSENGLEIIHDLGFIDLLDENYAETLKALFLEAYEKSMTLPAFEEASLESVGRCHHDRTCDFIQLIIDEQQIEFYSKSTEKNYDNDSCKVNFSYNTLKKVENATKINFTDFKNIEKDYQVDFFRLWSPITVRRYRIGIAILFVYSLGRGDRSRYFLSKEEKLDLKIHESAAHYIQGNDVLFHGQRFDFIHFYQP